MLTFIELPSFASVRDKYLNDDEFAMLQLFLSEHPDAGDIIPNSGGVGNYAGQSMVGVNGEA
jgi:hypothetical protein